MQTDDDTMKEVNPDAPTGRLTEAANAQIAALVAQQRSANGVLMQAVNFVGGQVEDGLKLLPKSVRGQIDGAARSALQKSYDLAAHSRGGSVGRAIGSDRMHRILGTISGALGGLGGLPTALLELPVATTIIFRAVQRVAQEHGEDPTTQETRLQCLAVFGAGAPGADDDGVDTAFIGARLSLTGAAVNGLIGKVAPRFATVLSQKLASQAVPVLGAVAGAGTNYAFVDYYVAVAHVHFGLRRLAREFGEDTVADEFHRVLAASKISVRQK